MHADSGIFPATIIGSNDGNDQDGSPNPELSDADDNIMREDALDDDPVHAVV